MPGRELMGNWNGRDMVVALAHTREHTHATSNSREPLPTTEGS